MEQQTGSKFEGWAVVELFGHQREAGYVTTQYFGDKAMFQLDVPALEERQLETKRPGYVDGTFAAAGTKVTKSAVTGRTRFISPGAVYALNPCSKDAALGVLEELAPREIKIVELAKTQQIAQGESAQCGACGGSGQSSEKIIHAPGCENESLTDVELEEETRA